MKVGSVGMCFFPVIGGPENIPVCEFINLRCILAKGAQSNCAPGIQCKNLLKEDGYNLSGDTWACVSCGVPFGSNIHSPSCGIKGPAAK